ncbi:hypothetical protein BS78_02G329600 [Paspalum vaginatum]|nr:hypothetical protein BS78_02G329600 [Paspalum vaginatum]
MQEIALLPVQQSPLWGDGSQNGQLQSQFHPRGSFHGFQPALIPTCEIGTLHHGQLQFHPPSHPIGPIGAFQNPCSKLIGFEDHFQSLSIPGDVMQSNYQSDSRNVDGYPSNYKVQTEHSCSHSSLGNCTNGENCRFSHVSNYTETNNMRQVDHLVSLQMLDMEITLQILEREIRDLLLSQPSSSVPVDHLEKKYLERYEKPLDFEGFQTEGQMNRKVDCSLTDLLMQLNTIKVIERQGHHFVVLVNDDPKYLTHGSESVMPPARTDSDQIYITFKANKSITETDIQSYFSKYGTVSEVRLPSKQRRMFGFVRFLDPGTARRIISERGPHFICGNEIRVKPYKERDELKISEEKDDHSNCIVCKVSNVDVIGEHHTGDNEAESSSVPTRLDRASADQS